MKRAVLPVATFLCALLLLLAYPFGGPFDLRYDAFDYMQMAESLRCFPDCPFGFTYVPALMPDAAYQTTFPAGFPLAIHLLHTAGASLALASHLVPAIAYALSAVLVLLIGRQCLGSGGALALAGLFATSTPVLRMGRENGPEMLAIALMLSAILAAGFRAGAGRRASLRALASGALAGACIWVRYAMAPVVAALFVALAWCRWRAGLRTADTLLAGGAAIAVTGLLAAVNLGLGGSLAGPYREPSDTGLLQNAATMANYVAFSLYGFLGDADSPRDVALVAALLAATAGWAVAALRHAHHRGWTLHPGYVAALVFIPGYLAFIVATSSVVEYNSIEPRFLAPFTAAWVVAACMPLLDALGAPGKPLAARIVCAVLLLAYIAGQHLDYRANPVGETERPPFALRIGSPATTAAIERVLERPEASARLLVSNSKQLLVARRWPAGEVYIGRDANFLPSIPDRDDVANWICGEGKSLLIVLDGSFAGMERVDAGDYVRDLASDAPGHGWKVEFSGREAFVATADPHSFDCPGQGVPPL